MKFTSVLFAVLSFGSIALAVPADATTATPSPAAQLSQAAPNGYCDKFDGRERRECESDPNYCRKFDGRERRDCEDARRAPPYNPSGGSYCRKFDGRERRDCENDPNYCNKFDNRERRDCQAGRQPYAYNRGW